MRRQVLVCLAAVATLVVLADGQVTAGADRSAAVSPRVARPAAGIPQLVAYQGKLTDSAGRPVDDGSYVMVFSLSADSVGLSFWRETQTVATTGGLFNVLLGSNVPIPADSVPQGGCYLGIRVMPAAQEFRRQRIVSVPFAFLADNADKLQGKDTSGFVRADQANSVTSAMIADGTIDRADVAAAFKAPLSDTADYARLAPAADSARVAGSSHLLQGKDTAALWNAKTLQGKDTTGFVRTNQANSVSGAMIVDATIVRADVASGFKAPYSDTADYASSAPASDSARVAGNSHLIQNKDTTALWDAKTLRGKDTADFVQFNQANSVTSAMIVNGEIVRADVAPGFKAPYADTADYAVSAPASDSARVAGNSHLLQNKDTAALWNAKTLQGKDTSGFVRTDQANSVSSAMITNGTIVRADASPNFKAPYSDTADYALSAPASDSARVAGNSHLLLGKDTTALWNAKTLQGKDTTGFVRTNQANAISGAMVVDGTIVRSDVAANFKAPFADTADFAISAPASDSARVSGNSHLLQGKDTTALWNAKTLQGKDTTALSDARTLQGQDTTALWNAKTLQGKDTSGFVRSGQADAVTGAMVVNGTIVRADVAADFKAPYSDTADYAIASPASDSARVAGNSHLLQNKDTAALWNAKTLQGKDTSGFVRTDQANSISSAMITNGTIVRADASPNFRAPYSDTADYALSAPASDSARVAGNSHLLQGKDTTALWNAKTLQGKDTTGFVRTGQSGSISSAMIVDGTIVRTDVAAGFKAPYADTADYAVSAPASDSARVAGNSHLLQGKDTTAFDARYVNEGQAVGGDLTGNYPNPTIAGDKVTSAKILDGTIVRSDVAATFKSPYADTADYAVSAPASDSARVAGSSHLLQGKDTTALWNAKTLQGKDTSDFVRSGQADVVTSVMIVNGTIARADVATDFKAPYADTADYAISAPASDSARVAGNSHLLQGKDTTDLWNAKTLQGRDTTGFVRTAQADAVTSAMIVPNTIVRADVATSFKAPFADTADYAIAAPASDSARVAGNSHLLQGKDTTGFVLANQSNSITSSMIVNGAIARTDVAADFKAPYSDTADYAISAPASDSARVAGNSHLLQGKDTTALWNAKTLQGQDTAALWNAKTLQGLDTAGFVRTNQANSVSSGMVVDGSIARVDVAASFKAPFADTADYAIAAPASDSARVAGNSHLLQSKDTTDLWNAKTLQGKDTTALWDAKTLQGKDTNALDARFVNEGQAAGGDLTDSYPNPTLAASSVTSAKIVDGSIMRVDVAANFSAPYSDTAEYARAAPPSDSARVAGNSYLLQGKDTTALWNAKALQGKDTTALWNAKTLQGKDTTGFVLAGQTDAVTSLMIVNGTVDRADVVAGFKAPYSDTADYARAGPAVDSARVAGNSHLLQGKDTTDLWNAKSLQGKDTTALADAKTLQGQDTTALWNSKTLQGKDTTGFVRTGQSDAVTSAMIASNTIVRSDVAASFKSPYSDTADYAIAALAADSTRVAGNSRLLLGRDTTALWNAKTLQGKDTSAFVLAGQANSIVAGMVVDTNVTMAKLQRAGAATGQVIKWNGSAWAPGNDSAGGGVGLSSISQASGVVCSPNPITSTGTIGFDSSWGDGRYINEGQSVGGDLVGSYPSPSIAANAVSLSKIARGNGADSGKTILSRGQGNDPAWGYPAAVGDSSPTPMRFLRFGTVAVDFPNANGPATVETTATISGVRVGDQVYVFSSSTFDTRFVLSATCSVTANDVIRLRACLPTNQNANPASDNMHYVWIRP